MILVCVEHPRYPLRIEVRTAHGFSDIDWQLLGDDALTSSIDHWVQANQIGRRISYNMWSCTSRKEKTAFLLRWHGYSVT
jgi:hypothetical protein